MKDLLYKELRLSANPTTWLFLLFPLMLLIPSYPYYVAFLYSCLGIYFIFQFGRENGDILFTALLPVEKGDVVRARILFVSITELAAIIISIPFAVISTQLLPKGHNLAGIEANVAFFGLSFVLFGGYNRFFFPAFYKTGHKMGKPLLFGGVFVLLYIIIAESLAQYIPSPVAVYLDTAPAIRQLPVLFIGIALWILLTWRSCRLSVKHFEEVDL